MAARKNSRLPSAPAIGEGKVTIVGAAERGREGRDVGAHRLMHRRIAHDAFLDVGARRLELRLDQGEDMCAGRDASAIAAGSTSLSEMKLTSIT